MSKKQLIISLSGLALVMLLFIFGSTIAPKSKGTTPVINTSQSFDILKYIDKEKIDNLKIEIFKKSQFF